MDNRTKHSLGRNDTIAALASRVGDDGTGDLGVIVDHASDDDTVDDLVSVVREAREDALAARRAAATEVLSAQLNGPWARRSRVEGVATGRDGSSVQSPGAAGRDFLAYQRRRKGKAMSNAIIYEQGNGLPSEGDYCAGEGLLWLVESIDSRIQTGDARGNYVYATVSEAYWEDCSEDDEHTARVVTMRQGRRSDLA